MHPVNDSAGAIYVRGRPKYSSFFGIRDLTRLKAGVRNLWKNWERYLDGVATLFPGPLPWLLLSSQGRGPGNEVDGNRPN